MDKSYRFVSPVVIVLILVAAIVIGLMFFHNSRTAQGQANDVRSLPGQNMVVPVNSFKPLQSNLNSAQGPDLPGAAELKAATGGKIRITTNPATGVASFVSLLDGASLNLAPQATQPEAQAAAFWAQYGGLFGIQAPDQELKLVETTRDTYGFIHLKYEQVYQGVPVFGGELRVHLNQAQAITAVNGTFLPQLDLNVTPAWSAADAAALALKLASARGNTADLAVVDNRLVVYRTRLAQRVGGVNALAYALEVSSADHSVRQFIFIDAHSGKKLDQYSGIHENLDRKIYESSLASVVWQDSAGNPDPITPGWAGGTAQQVTDWQNEIDGARETYNLFASMNAGSYLSYNGSDATMRTVNNDPTINCPNANWNGVSTNYCSNVTGDDTVAHEWGHAYTEYTNNLVYAWQSGALNESYSDIWGEVVDLLNGRGQDSPDNPRTAGSCSAFGFPAGPDNSYRWLSGEDDPAFGGAIRDMWAPTCYGDPGKVSDSQYVCTTADSGGVHTNSSVPNHAFALMVDGGGYNGQTVSGIGLTKAAHIEWAAQNMLTSISDFSDNADALEAACTALVGVNLPALSTSATNPGPSGLTITTADCTQVGKAITAVEMRNPPTQCNFSPMLDPNTPALCGGGTVNTFFTQNWESGIGSWTVGMHDVFKPSTFSTADWAVVGSLPDARPGSAAYVQDYQGGDCSVDIEAGALNLDSPAITIPAGADFPALSFTHWVSTEPGWDGGNLKVRVNGGAWTLLPASAYTFNAYPANLNTSGAGNDNPLAGQAAFTGSDGGTISGSWGTSRVDLNGIAGPGDTVQLRFDMGVDGCNGLIGWFVDDVQMYSCSAPAVPAISVSPTSLSNQQGSNQVINKTLTIDNQGAADLDWTLGKFNNLADGSFESGSPNPSWSESSTNFGTPLCDSGCSASASARTGSWFAWFGGISTYESGQLSQSVIIPSGGTANLNFYLRVWTCDSPSDYLEVRVDGDQVYKVDGSSGLCGSSSYVLQSVSLNAYADGGQHNLAFHSEIFADNAGISNFLVDDVSISPAITCDRPQDLPWFSTNTASGTIPGLSSYNLIGTFNSTGLAQNTYQATLCFGTNDPAKPVLQVPVSMQVSAGVTYHLYLPLNRKP